MDKIKTFQIHLKNILNKHCEEDKNSFLEYDMQRVIDDANGHYILCHTPPNREKSSGYF